MVIPSRGATAPIWRPPRHSLYDAALTSGRARASQRAAHRLPSGPPLRLLPRPSREVACPVECGAGAGCGPIEETVARIDNVTTGDVRVFAEDIAASAPAALALYGPVGKAPGLEALQARRAA